MGGMDRKKVVTIVKVVDVPPKNRVICLIFIYRFCVMVFKIQKMTYFVFFYAEASNIPTY